MTTEEIIADVERICRKHQVLHLYLFGSYAIGTQTQTSDIDFIVKGCENIGMLREEVDRVQTLKKIDLFDYDHIRNEHLKEAMDRDGKKIY